MAQAHATYSVKKWDRRPWHSTPIATGTKLYRIELFHSYLGDIKGEGAAQYLISQTGENDVNFVALEIFNGSIKGRSGSFVLQRIGTFDDGKVKETMTVIPHSGAGDLSGLSGNATLEHAQHQETYPIILDFEVPIQEVV